MGHYTRVLLIVATMITCLNYIFQSHVESNSLSLKKALVVLDDWNLVDSHSLFWDQLRNASYELEFKMMDDSSIKLSYFGEYLYDSIILCAPSMTLDLAKKSNINKDHLLKFFDDGHDIMILADKHVSSFTRDLVTEFGSDFDENDSLVKDSLYLHSYKKELNEDLVELKNDEVVVTKNTIDIKNLFTRPNGYILFEGIGQEVDPHNHYLFPVLKAEENTYSINSKTGVYYNFGDKIKLVNAYQGRNNRRVIISGSINMCSNEFYFYSSLNHQDIHQSPNAVFCQDLINWNFQRVGVLRYENVRHQRKQDGQTFETYRIKDELEYMVDIYEYNYKTNQWKPFLSDDLQVEYSMMEPFYRLQLKLLSSSKPTYYVSFKVNI